MVKLVVISALCVGIHLGTVLPQKAFAVANVIVGADVHPTEAKYDKLMTKYANGLKVALAEKDDKKTIAMVKKLNDEFIVGIEKIKPELESWIKNMTEKDKEAFEARAGEKEYLKTMFTIMFDPEIVKRINGNPELKLALESLEERTNALGLSSDKEDEEEEFE